MKHSPLPCYFANLRHLVYTLQLAKLMGTSQQAISRIESGEYEGFTLKTLEKIAEATGTRVKIEFVAA